MAMTKANITTKQRIAAFLAQTAHESAYYTVLQENLNYSESGLLKVFGKYFTSTTAKLYARKPSAIASRVYANRLGNGDEKSMEGWTYRGRGIIQLTGKYNYSKFAEYKGMSLSQVTSYLETKEGAVEAATWFWEKNGLNKFSDTGSITAQTKVINGGSNGLSDRITIYNKALKVLG